MQLRAAHQFLRVKRYLKKVRLIAKKQFPEGVDDHVEDEVYAFFLNCHHFKDWVIEDASLSIAKQTVENFVKKSKCLKICADLANAHKHCGLDPAKRPKSNPMPNTTPDLIYPILVHMNLRISPALLGLEANIQSDHGEYDYLVLAEECFEAWVQFLRANSAPDAFFKE